MKPSPLPRMAGPTRRTGPKRTAGFTASKAQRAKIALNPVCAVCGADRHEARIDPAHVLSRALGGCDAADCVLPLCAKDHRSYDDGKLDLSPYLVGRVAEAQHALGHTNGSLTRLLRHLSGRAWTPVDS